jgi:flagellar motor protein MotB
VTIPLTFDWLTVAWLTLRLSLWWRAGAAPSLVARRPWLLLLLGILSGCVPVTRFEETQSAAQVEMEGRRRSEQEVSRLEAENHSLRAQLAQQQSTLEAREQALSEASLDSSTLGKQREDAESMVAQLRGELARVGGHLQAFNADKQKLTQALTDESARSRALARLTRDVTLAFADAIATGEYVLDAAQNRAELRVPRADVLADGGTIKPNATPLLQGVARLLQLHQQVKLRVEDTGPGGDASAVSRLLGALGERGVKGERFEPLAENAAPAAAPAAASPELVFGFSVP